MLYVLLQGEIREDTKEKQAMGPPASTGWRGPLGSGKMTRVTDEGKWISCD